MMDVKMKMDIRLKSDRQNDKWIDMQRDRQTCTQANRWIERQTYGQKDEQTEYGEKGIEFDTFR